MPTSGTDLASFLPSAAAGEITVPKGPSSALDRAVFVDRAAARFGIEKNAVPIGVFDEAFPPPHLANKLAFKRVDFQIHPRGKFFDFRLVDPYKPRGTAAAVSALRTLELEPILVPRKSSFLL